MSPRIFVKNNHHISWKNWGIDDFIDMSHRIFNLGLPLSNDEFLRALDIIKRIKGGEK